MLGRWLVSPRVPQSCCSASLEGIQPRTVHSGRVLVLWGAPNTPWVGTTWIHFFFPLDFTPVFLGFTSITDLQLELFVPRQELRNSRSCFELTKILFFSQFCSFSPHPPPRFSLSTAQGWILGCSSFHLGSRSSPTYPPLLQSW